MSPAELARLNAAILAFSERPSLKFTSSDFGGVTMGYAIYDDATYDGESLGMFDTPAEALIDWHETEIEAQAVAA